MRTFDEHLVICMNCVLRSGTNAGRGEGGRVEGGGGRACLQERPTLLCKIEYHFTLKDELVVKDFW